MKRHFVVLIPILLLAGAAGWQMNNLASAASVSRRICLSNSGDISRKSKCSSTDTEIATGRVRAKPIAKKAMKNGTSRLASTGLVTANDAMGSTASPEQPLVSTLGASVRSYTSVLTFPADWQGSATTSCSSTEIAIGAYATAFIGGKRIASPPITSDWTFNNGYIARQTAGQTYEFIGLYAGENSNTALITSDFSYEDWPHVAIPSTLVLYVTQLCAPLTTLEGVG